MLWCCRGCLPLIRAGRIEGQRGKLLIASPELLQNYNIFHYQFKTQIFFRLLSINNYAANITLYALSRPKFNFEGSLNQFRGFFVYFLLFTLWKGCFHYSDSIGPFHIGIRLRIGTFHKFWTAMLNWNPFYNQILRTTTWLTLQTFWPSAGSGLSICVFEEV